MRYERLADIVKLTLRLQARADGLSLQDIMDDFKVSRRTAERMRDAALSIFPQIEELTDLGKHKRWRLPAASLGRLSEPTLSEITALNRGAELCRREGDTETAEKLLMLQDRLRASLRQESKRRLEPDIAALLEADGVAHRPGPREIIDPNVLSKIREAILAGLWINIDHRGRSKKLSRDVWLGPLAMLMGEGTQYLIAWSNYQEDVRLFTLSGIEHIEIMNDVYERPDDFDLQAYINQSFGVFQEEVQEIEWKFSPKVAADAARYQFHPTQKTERLDDGSLVVKFRAGGLLEMSWHLVRWGDEVEVLKPNTLVENLNNLKESNLHES